MLQCNRLKQSLKAKHSVFGLLNSIAAPLLVEMAGYAGYDFVILDLEHTSTHTETLENMIRAAECAGITPLVRVPETEPATILRALDSGAQGVVIPHVTSPQQAAQAVQACRYHPLGQRGISGGRTTGFGRLSLADYFERANAEILVTIMIEDRAGVENLPQILSVPGIDMVLEGAVDLSQSYAVPGQFTHPLVLQAVQRIADTCRVNQVPFCAVPRNQEQFHAWQARGVQAFLLGDDRGLAFKAFKSHVEFYRAATGGAR